MATAVIENIDFRTEDFDLSNLKEDSSAGSSKINKVPDMSRMSTPKPIMHLGSSTEVFLNCFNNK